MDKRNVARRYPRRKKRPAKVSLKATLPTELETIANAVDQLSAPEGLTSKLNDLRRDFAALRKGHRNNLRRQLVSVYDLATFLREDSSAWVEFCRLDEWKNVRSRPRTANPTNVLRHVIRFIVGFGGDTARKKASKYHKALSRFFEEGVPPTEIEQKIREGGGIEKLARANAKQRKTADTYSEEAKEMPEITLKLSGEKVKRLLEIEGALPIRLKIRKMKAKGSTLSARLLSVKIISPK